MELVIFFLKDGREGLPRTNEGEKDKIRLVQLDINKYSRHMQDHSMARILSRTILSTTNILE